MPAKWNAFTNNFDIVSDVSDTVVGPLSSTDNAVVRFDGPTGLIVQDSGSTISDANVLSTGEINLTTDLAVEYGGTGRGDGTAYSIVCSGTTSTGAQQSVSGLGSTGQVLTSAGAAALPAWAAVAGTGDVSAAANLTDNALIRGDGGAKGIQDSSILIDDSDNLSGVATIDIDVGGDLQINSTSVLNATALGGGIVSSNLTAVGKITTGIWESTDVGVAHGGTGRSSHTAYGVICGGTTGTAAQQSIASVGSANEVLTSNGAGALPTFQAASGGDVTKVGTPVDSQIGVWTGDGTIEGDASLTFDTSTDTLAVAASGKFNFGAVAILSDSAGTMTLSNVDALDATTESTIEAAIDTLSNLTSIGTIATGVWEATDVGVAYGGTGVSTLTDHGALIGSGTGAITALGVASNGQLIVGSTGADPVVASVASTDGSLTITAGAGTLVIEGTAATATQAGVIEMATDSETNTGTATDRALTPANITAWTGDTALVTVGTIGTGTWEGTAVTAANGGTGATSLTDNGVLVGSGTAAVTALTVGTNGQLLVGSTTADPVFATVSSSDSSIEFTTGAGTLSIQGAAASDTQAGVIEMATDAETNTGTATDRALTPANITAWTGDTALVTTGTITTGTWTATDIAAADGGTGRSSHTAYAVICGGTTTTAAQQSIASVGTAAQVLTSNGAGALPTFQAAAVDMPEIIVGGLAASHQVNTTTAFPPVAYRDFTSIEMLVRRFDATGPEYMQGSFRVPADLGAGASSVTFEIVGSSVTASASKNVKFTFDFVQVADDGLLTGSYGSAEVWDDQSISGTQDDQDIISNTETITNLAWVAGRQIYYRLYREAATTTNLTTDYDVIEFNIRIPQA